MVSAEGWSVFSIMAVPFRETGGFSRRLVCLQDHGCSFQRKGWFQQKAGLSSGSRLFLSEKRVVSAEGWSVFRIMAVPFRETGGFSRRLVCLQHHGCSFQRNGWFQQKAGLSSGSWLFLSEKRVVSAEGWSVSRITAVPFRETGGFSRRLVCLQDRGCSSRVALYDTCPAIDTSCGLPHRRLWPKRLSPQHAKLHFPKENNLFFKSPLLF